MSTTSGSWVRTGCFGCVAIAIVLVAAGLVVLAVLRSRVRSEEARVETIEREIVLPGGEAAPPSPEEGRSELATSPPAIRVVLDLAHADFEVAPGNPGEELRVEARFDPACCDLEELRDDAASPPEIRIRFRRRSGRALGRLRELLGGVRPRVRLYLPPDRPLELRLDLSQGGAEMELGGLWLTSADLKVAQGGLVVEISRPTREPMESLTLTSSMGGLVASHLGNASPRVVEVEGRMGGVMVDLRGHWFRDADIRIATSMGGGGIRLPPGVRTEGLPRRSAPIREEEEEDAPLLRFDVSAAAGNLEVIE